MRAASEYDSTTVKVGYYENEVFEEGAAKGAVKTGYAYEYYRKLSEYTGWKYEYVYGSYSELYDKLLEGEIDFLAGLAKKDERIGLIGYPSDDFRTRHCSHRLTGPYGRNKVRTKVLADSRLI